MRKLIIIAAAFAALITSCTTTTSETKRPHSRPHSRPAKLTAVRISMSATGLPSYLQLDSVETTIFKPGDMVYMIPDSHRIDYTPDTRFAKLAVIQ